MTSFQGDVGCGKTVVAFLACMEVLGSGFQVSNCEDFILLLLIEKISFLHLTKYFSPVFIYFP